MFSYFYHVLIAHLVPCEQPGLTLPGDSGSGELRHDGMRVETGPDALDVGQVGGSG